MVLNLILLLLSMVIPTHTWNVGEQQIIVNDTILDASFDNSTLKITCYYTPTTYMSTDMNVQITLLKNGQHVSTHRLNCETDFIGGHEEDDGWYNDNIYAYSFTLYNVYHTDTIRLQYTMNDDSDNTLGLITYTSFEVVDYSLEDYDEGFDEGYNIGYNTGHEDGYNTGYVQGTADYQTNAENVDGTISRMWGILENATNTVMNVLALPILPGIPLYMLIFFPIIIAILIFILRNLAK